MKNPIKAVRRFFVRTRTYQASAAAASHAGSDDDSDSTRLSGAFLIVLVLHIIAVIGVFAFARIRKDAALANPAPAAPPKTAPAKPGAQKPAAPKPAAPGGASLAPAAASLTPATASVNTTPRETTRPAAPAQKTHIVKENETLTKIANTNTVTVADLAAANHIKPQDKLRAGQVLTIPSATTAQATTTETKPATTDPKAPKTYVVKKGDSPMKIAREHGCSYEELMKVNAIKDPKKIQLGQVLKLPVKNG